MSSQSTLDRSMITESKVMSWIRKAANDINNLTADPEHLAIGFAAAFNKATLPEWAWSEFCVLADLRLEALNFPRRYFAKPTSSQETISRVTETENRIRARFPKSGPLGDLIVPLSTLPSTVSSTASPAPATNSPTPHNLTDFTENTNTAYVATPALPRASTPTTPRAAEVKEAEITAAELRDFNNNEPHRFGPDGFIVTQPEDFETIPVGVPEEDEEMEDHNPRPPTRYQFTDPRAPTPPPAQKEQDEEARFFRGMEDLTERTVRRTNAPLHAENARLTRELTTANTTIARMAGQITNINMKVDEMSKQLTAVLTILSGNQGNNAPIQTNNNSNKAQKGKETANPPKPSNKSYAAVTTNAPPNDKEFTTVTKEKKKKTAPPFIRPEYTRVNRQVIIETAGPAPKDTNSDAILRIINRIVSPQKVQFIAAFISPV